MEFNPYCEWLAIPPCSLPPSHYRLLGLKDFESDLDKIQRAALNQIARLRVHQAGPHSDLTQKLMNEVALARITLSDGSKKEEYDRQLRQSIPRVSGVTKNPFGEEELGSDDSVERSSEWEENSQANSSQKDWRRGPIRTVFAVSVATVALLALIAVFVIGLRRTSAPPLLDHSSKNVDDVATQEISPAVAAKPAPEEKPSREVKETSPSLATPVQPVPGVTSPPLDHAPTAPVESIPNPVPPADPPEEPKSATPTDEDLIAPEPNENSSLIIERKWSVSPKAAPWKPGVVTAIGRANTSVDESYPFLSKDGLELYFTRRTGRGDEIFVVRRSTPDGEFQQEGRLQLASSEPFNSSATFSSDGERLLFNREVAGQYSVMESARTSAVEPFKEERKLNFENIMNQQGDPFLTADGLHLVMSAGQGKFTRIWMAGRAGSEGDFTEPHPLELEGSYRRPSVAGDLCTIYMEGMLPDGRTAIFRAMRESTSSPWSRPTVVQEIRDNDGNSSDFTPRISDDGKLLLFASNRSGGAGGKDLFVYPLDKMPTVEPPPSAPPADRELPANGLLLLGPIPKEIVGRIQSLSELTRRYFPSRDRRAIPKVGDMVAEIPWRISDSTSEKAGLYLVVYPFTIEDTTDVMVEVEDSPGGMVLWLDNKEILTLGQSKPWEAVTSKKVDRKSTPISLRKGTHRLYGLLCAPEDQPTVSVRLLNGDSKPLGMGFELHPQ
ncbi:hypothetical protein K2Y11_24790 [bacterium]|nr:hypothetical protein [bacterium]